MINEGNNSEAQTFYVQLQTKLENCKNIIVNLVRDGRINTEEDLANEIA